MNPQCATHAPKSTRRISIGIAQHCKVVTKANLSAYPPFLAFLAVIYAHELIPSTQILTFIILWVHYIA